MKNRSTYTTNPRPRIPAKRSAGLFNNYRSVGERFNAPLYKTNIAIIAIRLAASKFSIIHNPAYVCIFILSKPGKCFSAPDNATHLYFFVFSKSAKSFSTSDNATHVYFFVFSKPGKSFSTSDNATHVYFYMNYVFVNPPRVHFCNAGKTNGTPITLKIQMNTDFNRKYNENRAFCKLFIYLCSFVPDQCAFVDNEQRIVNSE
jgi:hypothetical protein